eukprot:CFRG4918T1
MPKFSEVTDSQAQAIIAEEKERVTNVVHDDDSDDSESLLDRISALVEFIPEPVRNTIHKAGVSTHSFTVSSLKGIGTIAWIGTTTFFVLGLPLLLAVEGEQALEAMEMERKQQLQQQRQILNPGLYGVPASPTAE